MITVRRSQDRGYFDYGWLQTHHTFSFNDYYDSQHMGFRNLRVINQDIVAPGRGFDLHAHHDMEIITYVIRGAITHKDSMGNESTIHAGEAQRMTAGSGVKHAEYNHSKTEELELLQIWILPEEEGLPPSYQQNTFKKTAPQFRLLAAPQGQQDSLLIHQNVKIFLALMTSGQQLEYSLPPNRYAWIQLISGNILVNSEYLYPGDGAAIAEQDLIEIKAEQPAELLLFDLN